MLELKLIKLTQTTVVLFPTEKNEFDSLFSGSHVRVESISNDAGLTLTPTNSDVSLIASKGATEGAIVGEVYPNMWLFRNLIPKLECLISPFVKFAPKFPDIPIYCRESQYLTIRIPHALANTLEIKSKVRVRYGDIFGPSLLMKQAKPKNGKTQEVSYEVDDNNVTVYSRYLTGFVVTLSCFDCYRKDGSILVYGSMDNGCVSLKAFLCSSLCRIKDFRKVRNNDINMVPFNREYSFELYFDITSFFVQFSLKYYVAEFRDY